MTTAPEPKGKLDAMTVQLDAEAEAARIVNGPKGDVLVVDWDGTVTLVSVGALEGSVG